MGRAKLGYLNVRRDFGGRLVNTIDIVPERAPLIQWAFAAYATGNYTLVKLQAALADQGLTSRPSVRFQQKVISINQLSLILHDLYYTGVIRYKGSLYPGRHEPLISKTLFLKVQDVLSERARRGQRDREHHHWLKGMLFCGRCDRAGRQSRLVFTQTVGNGGTYDYFICTGRRQGACDLPSLPIKEVEWATQRALASEALATDFVDQLKEDVSQAIAETRQADIEMRNNLAKQIKKLDLREERLLDLASNGDLATSKLRARLQEITLERGALEESLTRTDADLHKGAATLLAYIELLSQPGALFDRSDDGLRRQVVDACFDALYADCDDQIGEHGRDLRALAPAIPPS